MFENCQKNTENNMFETKSYFTTDLVSSQLSNHYIRLAKLEKAGCFLKFNKSYKMVTGQETHNPVRKTWFCLKCIVRSRVFPNNFQTHTVSCPDKGVSVMTVLQ